MEQNGMVLFSQQLLLTLNGPHRLLCHLYWKLFDWLLNFAYSVLNVPRLCKGVMVTTIMEVAFECLHVYLDSNNCKMLCFS